MMFKAADCQSLKRQMTMLIASFYTALYRETIQSLIESIDRLQLARHIECKDSRGDWFSNTWIKPHFLRDVLNTTQGPVVWVDADAIIKRHPWEFDRLEKLGVDMGIVTEQRKHYHQHYFDPVECAFMQRRLNPDAPKLYRGGTIYLANNNRVREFLENWIGIEQHCLKHQVPDQYPIGWAAGEVDDFLIKELPLSYCSVFDNDKAKDPDPCIVHYQASRKFRDQTKGVTT